MPINKLVTRVPSSSRDGPPWFSSEASVRGGPSFERSELCVFPIFSGKWATLMTACWRTRPEICIRVSNNCLIRTLKSYTAGSITRTQPNGWENWGTRCAFVSGTSDRLTQIVSDVWSFPSVHTCSEWRRCACCLNKNVSVAKLELRKALCVYR